MCVAVCRYQSSRQSRRCGGSSLLADSSSISSVYFPTLAAPFATGSVVEALWPAARFSSRPCQASRAALVVVQVLDGITGAVLGVMTALIIADVTKGTVYASISHRAFSAH